MTAAVIAYANAVDDVVLAERRRLEHQNMPGSNLAFAIDELERGSSSAQLDPGSSRLRAVVLARKEAITRQHDLERQIAFAHLYAVGEAGLRDAVMLGEELAKAWLSLNAFAPDDRTRSWNTIDALQGHTSRVRAAVPGLAGEVRRQLGLEAWEKVERGRFRESTATTSVDVKRPPA